MSAYMVSAATIDAIISGARQYGGQTGLSFGYGDRFSRYASDDEADNGTYNPDTMGRELWQENLRSIHARYPDTVDGEHIPGPVGFSEAEALAYQYGPGSRVVEVDPLGLLGVIRGYRYQACEHRGWQGSTAERFTAALRDAVIDYLIDKTGANAWTSDDLDELTGSLRIDSDAGSWAIRFDPGTSAAVSLTERIARGR